MQSAATDKLPQPPRGGGRSKEKSGFRSAERYSRSLSRQIPAIPLKFPEEDMVFISKSDRLLRPSKFQQPLNLGFELGTSGLGRNDLAVLIEQEHRGD